MLLAGAYDCLRFLVGLVLSRRSEAERDAELLLLRHELSVLMRSVTKPRLRMSDRLILSALAMRLPRSRWNALIVCPETILVWHRAPVQRKWDAYRRRGRPGRPRMAQECRELILRLARAIRNLLRRHGVPTCPHRSRMSWREFLRAQASAIVVADYFTVETWNLKRLQVLFFMQLGRRRIVSFGVTANPNQAWVGQQVRNLIWRLEDLELAAEFLICDHDKKFPFTVDNTPVSAGPRRSFDQRLEFRAPAPIQS